MTTNHPFFALSLIALIGLATAARGGSPLAFVDVHVVPMDQNRVLEHQTVLVDEGTIQSVGPVARVKVPEAAQVIQGEGRFLIPGLSDLHVHVRRSDEYVNYLWWGVTTVMHLGGYWERGKQVLQDRRELTLRPNLYMTALTLDGDPPTSGNQFAIPTPQAAEKAVIDLHAKGSDFIKVYNNVSLPVFRALVETAGRLDMAVIGHIPRNFDAQQGLQGLDAVAHCEEFFFTYFKGPRRTKDMDRSYRPDAGKIPGLVDLLLQHDVAVMADLCFTFTNLLMWDDLDLVWKDPELAYQHPRTIWNWRASNLNRRNEIENFVFREQIKYDLMQELTRVFQGAGVQQLMGTDASLPGLFPGKAVHRELTELVKAGLSNFDALSVATRNGGAFIHKHIDQDTRFGCVLPGYRADLVLIEANPLEDLRRLRDVAGVCVAGRYWRRSELAEHRAALQVKYAAWNELNRKLKTALAEKDPKPILRRLLESAHDQPDRHEAIRDQILMTAYDAAYAGDLIHAQETLQLLTDFYPDWSTGWELSGELDLYQGEMKKAAKHFEKAIQADADNPKARYQLQKLKNNPPAKDPD